MYENLCSGINFLVLSHHFRTFQVWTIGSLYVLSSIIAHFLSTQFLASWGPPLEGRVDRSIYAGPSALGVSKQTCSVSITKVSTAQ